MKTPIIRLTILLLSALSLALLVLKLLGLIPLGWVWVLAPYWLPSVLMVCGCLTWQMFAGRRTGPPRVE